jgi:LPXTG-motif cell wall-anchored protein
VGFRVSTSGVSTVVGTPPASGDSYQPASDGDETLPRTGTDGTEALARTGAALVAVGGCLILAARKRRHRLAR